MASRSPKASYREDNGSHDGLGFNKTILIDQVEFTGTFGTHQSKSQAADVVFKAWGQPVTMKFFGTHSQEHSTVVKRPINTKKLCEGIVSGSVDTPLFS